MDNFQPGLLGVDRCVCLGLASIDQLQGGGAAGTTTGGADLNLLGAGQVWYQCGLGLTESILAPGVRLLT